MDLFPKETQNDVLKNVDKNASDSYSSLYFQITSQELNSQLALRHILHAEFCLTFETYFLLSMDTITPRRLSSLLDRTGNCQTLNRQRRRIPLGKGVKSVCVCVCERPPPHSSSSFVWDNECMCDNVCMSMWLRPTGRRCEDRRLGFVARWSRSLVPHAVVTVSWRWGEAG